MQFNQECWLLLMGFPLDHWNHEAIQSAVGSFECVLLWENDRRNLARLLVRARVTDFTDVTHFIVLTKSEGFQDESWTIQCEILQQELLGGGPANEEPIPVLEPNGQPPLFDLFGLGQPGQPPFNSGMANNEEENDNNADIGDLELDLNPLPDAAPAVELDIQPEEPEEQLILNLNMEPDGELLADLVVGYLVGFLDLNDDPILDAKDNQAFLHPEVAQIIPFAPQNQVQNIPHNLDIDLNEELVSMVLYSFQESSEDS
jgi:hypothetical protein